MALSEPVCVNYGAANRSSSHRQESFFQSLHSQVATQPITPFLGKRLFQIWL